MGGVQRPPNAVRILYCEGNVDGTVGGSYYSLLYLLEGLDRRLVDPLVVLHRETPIIDKFRRVAGEVRILRRHPPFAWPGASVPAIPGLAAVLRLLARALNFARFHGRVLRLAWFIRRHRVQLVHLNNSTTSNHDWMLASMLVAVPCVTHERGLNEGYSRLARWCAPRLAAILCISAAVKDVLIRNGVARDNLYLIPNGLDPASLAPGAPVEALRRQFGVEDGQPVLGLIGNLRAWKGQEVLLRALPEIIRAAPDVRCLLVGSASPHDSAYVERLHALVAELRLQEHVVFVGYCPNVADALSVVHVAVHASIAPEPFGRVLLEAMAMRRPVVATRAGAVPEVIEDGVTGYTFPPGDAAALAACVTRLLADPERARAFGEAGYERLRSRFSLARNVALTSAVYARILGRTDWRIEESASASLAGAGGGR